MKASFQLSFIVFVASLCHDATTTTAFSPAPPMRTFSLTSYGASTTTSAQLPASRLFSSPSYGPAFKKLIVSSSKASFWKRAASQLHLSSTSKDDNSDHKNEPLVAVDGSKSSFWQRLFQTTHAAGYPQAQTAGLFTPIKKAHNPITYLLLAFAAALKWNWLFRNPYYWFGVGFCIKWYRARYVFRIPVWDRQPNWNNIITSKEQEKDLKAYTCKNCGSTIFIAKTREFFFEGDTGIGGLGCFACGAKGKENFVMDRDRIAEDVADIDDYFEYERPLDFVSAAERRKLLKEAKGDEERANQMLIDQSNTASSNIVEAEVVDTKPSEEDVLEAVEKTESPKEGGDADDADDTVKAEDSAATAAVDEVRVPADEVPTEKKEKPKAATKKAKDTKKPPPPPAGDEDLDILDMDI